ETIHVTFDELTAMASEQFRSGPGPTSSSGLSSTSVVSPVQVAATPRAVDLADSPESTSIDQDTPSSSISSTQEQEQSLIISQGTDISQKGEKPSKKQQNQSWDGKVCEDEAQSKSSQLREGKA
ncbi:hypothetical protein Tco_0186653, partial [Tanacetum coccineum]